MLVVVTHICADCTFSYLRSHWQSVNLNTHACAHPQPVILGRKALLAVTAFHQRERRLWRWVPERDLARHTWAEPHLRGRPAQGPTGTRRLAGHASQASFMQTPSHAGEHHPHDPCLQHGGVSAEQAQGQGPWGCIRVVHRVQEVVGEDCECGS